MLWGITTDCGVYSPEPRTEVERILSRLQITYSKVQSKNWWRDCQNVLALAWVVPWSEVKQTFHRERELFISRALKRGNEERNKKSEDVKSSTVKLVMRTNEDYYLSSSYGILPSFLYVLRTWSSACTGSKITVLSTPLDLNNSQEVTVIGKSIFPLFTNKLKWIV